MRKRQSEKKSLASEEDTSPLVGTWMWGFSRRGLYLQSIERLECGLPGPSDLVFESCLCHSLILRTLGLSFPICKMEFNNYILMDLLWDLIQMSCLKHWGQCPHILNIKIKNEWFTCVAQKALEVPGLVFVYKSRLSQQRLIHLNNICFLHVTCKELLKMVIAGSRHVVNNNTNNNRNKSKLFILAVPIVIVIIVIVTIISSIYYRSSSKRFTYIVTFKLTEVLWARKALFSFYRRNSTWS